jgi:hypothetical protein
MWGGPLSANSCRKSTATVYIRTFAGSAKVSVRGSMTTASGSQLAHIANVRIPHGAGGLVAALNV